MMSEMESELDQDDEVSCAQAETGTHLSAAVLEQDLETIAEYIVHLKEDQIHKIAVQVKQGADGTPVRQIVKTPIASSSSPVAKPMPVAVARAPATAPRIVMAGPAPEGLLKAQPIVVRSAP